MIYCPSCYHLWPDDTDVSACDCGHRIDSMEATPGLHPVQLARGGRGLVPVEIAMAAYEVYCKLYGPQPALVTGNCRGGLGVGELVAFLYAKPFPKSEWRQRVNEAFEKLQVDRVVSTEAVV